MTSEAPAAEPTVSDRERDEAIAQLALLVTAHQRAIEEMGNHLAEQVRAFAQVSEMLSTIGERLTVIEAKLGIHRAAADSVN